MVNIHSPGAKLIGSRLRKARLALGISMEDLSALAELSLTTIGKIERGLQSPTVETLVRISCALNIDQSEIIAGLTTADFGGKSHQITVNDLIQARHAPQK